MSLGPARLNPWFALSQDEMRQQQVEKLASYLTHVVLPGNAYYRQAFEEAGFHPSQLREPDDLQRIPLMSKVDFSSPEAVRSYIIEPDAVELAKRPSSVFKALVRGKRQARRELEEEYRPLLMTMTTGRSADPVPFVYTARDLEVLKIAGERVMRVCGANKEQRMMNVFPFAPHLAFWITHYAGIAFGAMMVSTGGGKTMGTEGNLRMMRKYQPNVLIGIPTFIYHLLNAAIAERVKLPTLEKIVLGGEKAPAGMKRRLVELAAELGARKVEILCTYGFTEAKMAWGECPHSPGMGSPGYHLSPELGMIEVIDPASGELRAPGEPGEIVFTSLEARGSVVIRFRTGDLTDGGLFYERCPHCGRQVPRLVGEISRSSEIREVQLEKLKGTLIDFNQLEHLLDDCEHLECWQLELRKQDDDPLELDELILHVRHRGEQSDEQVCSVVNQLLMKRLEIRVNRIIFHSEGEMKVLHGVGRELKEQRIVDRRGCLKPAAQPREEEAHV